MTASKPKELESNPMRKPGESAHCIAHAGGQLPRRVSHSDVWRYTREHGVGSTDVLKVHP